MKRSFQKVLIHSRQGTPRGYTVDAYAVLAPFQRGGLDELRNAGLGCSIDSAEFRAIERELRAGMDDHSMLAENHLRADQASQGNRPRQVDRHETL